MKLMCGIVGIVGGKLEDLSESMMETIQHRGPDESGIFLDTICALGHQRLSIIDLSGSQQPMYSEDGNLVLVYNGEIYNFNELRNNLEKLGYVFTTSGDTEVVLKTYQEWGIEGFAQFNGMWAFAIWDKKQGNLILSRDHFGIKPLYYYLDDEIFIFSSEIKAILSHDSYQIGIDKNVLNLYFTFRYTPDERTIFEGIKKFPKGHSGYYADGELHLQQYYDLTFNNNQTDLEEFESKIVKAIEYRLIADVTVGSYLSGGLDSTLMSYTSIKKLGNLETFSLGFEDERYDETEDAMQVANYINSDHHQLKFESENISLDEIIFHTEDLLADATLFPVYQLSHFTSKYLKVVLSGDGLDELLGGYDKYRKFLILDRFRLPVKLIPNFLAFNYNSTRILNSLKKSDFSERYLSTVSVFTEDEKQKLFKDKTLLELSRSKEDLDLVKSIFNKEEDKLNKLLRFDQEIWLENDILLKTDKMTMAASIESRVPFLDPTFVDYCNGISRKYKIKGTKEKLILRDLLTKYELYKTAKRNKSGFTVPVDKFHEMAEELITEAHCRQMNLFNWDYIETILKSDLHNMFRRRQFFSLLYFFGWWKQYIGFEDN